MDKKTRIPRIRSSRCVFLFLAALLAVMGATSCGGGAPPNPNQPPIANAGGPYFTNAGQALSFDGSQSSAPSGQSLTYAWDFGDGGTATGVKPTHTYVNAGNFTVKLTVTDTGGATNSNSVPVLVVPLPVSNPGGPYSGVIGQAITFNGSASTVPPGQNASYSWNFGDNNNGTGAMPTHAYASAGTFTVTLSVEDDTGGVGKNSTTATITAGPSANFSSNKTFLAISSPAPGQPRFAYIASSTGAGDSILSVNVVDLFSGDLSPGDVMDPAIMQPKSGFDLRGIALDPLSRFLYVYSNDAVLNFAVDPGTGALTFLGTKNFSGEMADADGQLLAFHPSGKFAYVATQDPSHSDPSVATEISVYAVDPNSGALDLRDKVSAPVQNPNFTLIDPAGRFLYLSGSETQNTDSTSEIAAFSIDQSSGALTPVSESSITSTLRLHVHSMVADLAGRFVYAVGTSLDSNSAAVSILSIDKTTGRLTDAANSPVPIGYAGSTATSMSLDSSGKFAFVLTETPVSQSAKQENIQVLTLNGASGAPSAAATVTLPAISPIIPGTTGSLTLGQDVASITASDSSNTQTGSAASERNPLSHNTNASAAFLYVISPGDAGISLYSMDANTGVLDPVPTRISPPVKSPIGAAPR